MSTTFTRTREQLRSMVLRKLGVIGAATSVVSVDADIVYEAIDLRLKEMHRLGIYWRKVDEVPFVFSVGSAVASAHVLTTDIQFPILLTIRDGSSDEMVEIVGTQEWAAIPDKTRTGLPEKALWAGSDEFLFYPIPVVNTSARLTYERIANDTTAGSAVDAEVSMMRWMKDIIAYDVGGDFGMDEARMNRFMKEAAIAEKNIRKLAVERKSYGPVAVDSWEYPNLGRETDYGM
jgi:hypothetical protein